MSEVEFYPCACPCGCKNMSSVPAIGSSALARHARCESCLEPAHATQHVDKSAESDAESKPFSRITPYYTPSDEEKEMAREAALEVRKDIWEHQWAAWQRSLPEKFQNAETENATVKERLKRLRNGQQGVASMVILGAPGFGKTYLSIAYANAAIKEGFFKPSEVLFGTEAELLASAANSGFGDVEKMLGRVISRKVKFLILDDVGRGTWLNEAMRPKVFSLVLDKFWSQNRVIVVTSNLPPSDLSEYIGEGAMDRLRSVAGNSSVVLDTESKRKQITEEMLQNANRDDTVPPVPNNFG